jgi:DNA-directed RNA polymerase subunit alpha
LELPSEVVKDERVSTPKYGRFIIEPFERGFGTTVGNSLRRILLSSLEGAAVTTVKIAGADHEFASLAGVAQDVTDIILNVKGLILKLNEPGPRTMRVSANKAGPVRASDIEADPAIEVINTDQLLATLTADVDFEMEMTVDNGRGYRTADENVDGEREIGVIPVDAVFSPVSRVRYQTEDTRVGQRTNYDKLTLEIWTKGTILPENALVEAANILRKHLNPFLQYYQMGTMLADRGALQPTEEVDLDSDLQQLLSKNVNELDLSVRASNCLETAKIVTIGDLVSCTEADLLKVRSFGKTSLREVKRKLEDLGLELGMDLSQGLATQNEPVEAATMPDDPDVPEESAGMSEPAGMNS